jgi:hypothetical protein
MLDPKSYFKLRIGSNDTKQILDSSGLYQMPSILHPNTLLLDLCSYLALDPGIPFRLCAMRAAFKYGSPSESARYAPEWRN